MQWTLRSKHNEKPLLTKRQKFFSKVKGLTAGIIAAASICMAYNGVNPRDFYDSTICKMSDSENICLMDRKSTSGLKKELDTARTLLNQKNTKVFRVSRSGLFILHSEDYTEINHIFRDADGQYRDDAYGTYSKYTHEINIYPKSTPEVILHEISHRVYDTGFERSEKQKLEADLIKLRLVSALDENALKIFEVRPEVSNYLFCIREIVDIVASSKRYDIKAIGSSENLLTEIFAYMPESCGIPKEFTSVYSKIFSDEYIAKTKRNFSIASVLQADFKDIISKQ